MSFSREYAHRPPIPTAEEILEDFNSTKTKDLIDPVFVLSEKFPCIIKRGKKENIVEKSMLLYPPVFPE